MFTPRAHYRTIGLILLLSITSTHAHIYQAPSTSGTSKVRSLDSLFPNRGGNLQEEIKCYGLPYGGIGFTSHVLTYYSLLMIMNGRSPWTWKVNTHWRLDSALAIIALLLTTITSLITLVHCRNRWEFVCLAVWKLCMSLTVTTIALQIAFHSRKHVAEVLAGRLSKPYLPGNLIFGWFVLYILGLLAGFVGLLSLVKHGFNIDRVRKITLGFACTGLTLISMMMLLWASSEMERLDRKTTKILDRIYKNKEKGKRKANTERAMAYLSEPIPLATIPRPLSYYSELNTDQEYQSQLYEHVSEDFPNHDEDDEVGEYETPSQMPSRYSYKQDERWNGYSRSNPYASPTFAQKLTKAIEFLEQMLFSYSIRKQYSTGLSNGLGPFRVVFRIMLYLLLGALSLLGVVGAFYSDFVLGALAGNMSGWPSSDVAAFYWIYFAAKRLPLLFV